MGKLLGSLNSSLQDFIKDQHLFFVSTADVDGRVNLSPKGMDALRILDGNRLIWLNLTGSGNETAAHLLGVNRMTIMWCSFSGAPLILRVYGKARTVQADDADWEELLAHFPADLPGPRQVFDVQIESVQTSCGFGVPEYQYQGERDQLNKWANQKGDDGIREYWTMRNQESLDGKPTGIPVTE